MEFEDDDEEPLTPPSNKERIHGISLEESSGISTSAEYDGFSAIRAKNPFDFVKTTSALLRSNSSRS
ncbi:hypothetical protein K7432_010166 [Basidiobolus ranarum]|uniref:Uncharacterized protein n=1 Tax=Basidiobolus ranarum TaxID=34480 RepID=A0ABR2WP65_9FUNG